MDVAVRVCGMLRQFGQSVGPYLVLEILMPGGTLLALLLFLYRRRQYATRSIVKRRVLVSMRTLATVRKRDWHEARNRAAGAAAPTSA